VAVPSPFDPALSVTESISLNDNGKIAYIAYLSGNPFRYGLFLGPNILTDKVIERGDSLFGSTVIDIQFWNNGLNNNDQLAFYARLADNRQVIVRAEGVSSPTSVPESSNVFGLGLFGLGLAATKMKGVLSKKAKSPTDNPQEPDS
jgi:hypothetical protein